jgi:hypothetical protein
MSNSAQVVIDEWTVLGPEHRNLGSSLSTFILIVDKVHSFRTIVQQLCFNRVSRNRAVTRLRSKLQFCRELDGARAADLVERIEAAVRTA